MLKGESKDTGEHICIGI